MAAIGSGINPALGRIDYSPFLQGAQMAAQGRMQGSAALTEGISQGFQDYLKKREQNAILEGKNNALLREISQNPQLASSPDIQKYTSKMAKGGPLTLNDNIKLNAELTTTVEAVRNRQEQERQQAYLKLQQDAAAINADRAAREKAEYTRRNTFQENIIRIAKDKPEVLQDPKMAVAAVIDAGGNFEDAQRIQGNAITQQQFDLEKTQRQMEFAKRSLELAEAARRGEVTGKEPDVQVVEKNGVKVAYLLDALKQPIGQPHVIAQGKPDEGSLVESEALRYLVAEAKGDTAGMARHMINIKSKVKNSELMGEEQIRANYIQPFASGGNEPLKVQKVTPSSAKPAPTAEASAITQPANPTDAAAVPPMLARTGTPFAAPSAQAALASAAAMPQMSQPPKDMVIDESLLRGATSPRADANEAVANAMRRFGYGVSEFVTPSNWQGVSGPSGAPFTFVNKTKLNNLKSQLEALSNRQSETAKRLRAQIKELESAKR